MDEHGPLCSRLPSMTERLWWTACRWSIISPRLMISNLTWDWTQKKAEAAPWMAASSAQWTHLSAQVLSFIVHLTSIRETQTHQYLLSDFSWTLRSSTVKAITTKKQKNLLKILQLSKGFSTLQVLQNFAIRHRQFDAFTLFVVVRRCSLLCYCTGSYNWG